MADNALVPTMMPSSFTAHVSKAEEAFSIELIRVKVLEYVMWTPTYSDEEDTPAVILNIGDTKSLRLVNYTWHQTVTQILRYENEPLFKIGTQRRPRASTLKWLQSATSEETSVYIHENGRWIVPTYNLDLNCAFFVQENHQTLTDLLLKLGSGVLNIFLQFPVDATMTTDFNGICLPRLRKLTVDTTEYLQEDGEYAPSPEEAEESRIPVPNRNFQELLQQLLNASKRLTHLVFERDAFDEFGIDGPPMEYYYFPNTFKQIVLPSTLVKIDFHCSLHLSNNLQILVSPQNPLPQLTSLTLTAFHRPFEMYLIHEILSKFSHTLETLNLEGTEWSDGQSWTFAELERTQLKLPKMVSLTTLRVRSARWTLPPGTTHLMGKLPKLELLILKSPETVFLERWTNEAVYKSVETLQLFLLGTERLDMEVDEEEIEEVEDEEIEEVEDEEIEEVEDEEIEEVEDEEIEEVEDEEIEEVEDEEIEEVEDEEIEEVQEEDIEEVEEEEIEEVEEEEIEEVEEEEIEEVEEEENDEENIDNMSGEIEVGDDFDVENINENYDFEEDDVEGDEEDEDEDLIEEEETVEVVELPHSTNMLPALPLSSETIARVQRTFPELTVLFLAFASSPEKAGLQSLFTQLPQLVHLDLRITDDCAQLPGTFWDSVITGLADDELVKARKMYEILESPELELNLQQIHKMIRVSLNSKIKEIPAIARMRRVKDLLFACKPRKEMGEIVPVLSDIAFYLGFAEMPRLLNLELGGGFKPSDKIISVLKTVDSPITVHYYPEANHVLAKSH